MPTKRHHHSARRLLAGICATALAAAGSVALPGTAHADGEQFFHHIATAALTGATASTERAIDSASSADGKTLVSADSSGLVFTDLADPAKPRRIGRIGIAKPVAVAVAGARVLVATDSGLTVVDLARRTRLGSISLSGTPTDVATSPDGKRAAVALDSGRLVLFSGLEAKPADWKQQHPQIELDPESGLLHRTDPRPHQIAYSPDGRAIAITLPYNNGISIVQASDGDRIRAISAGTANLTGIDTTDDGAIKLSDNLYTQERRPTGVAWIDGSHLASSSPGTRSWSVYDTKAGKLTWDSGTGLEYRAIENGLYADAYSADGGISPDTVAVGTFGGTPYAFIGAEHGNLTASYSLADVDEPEYRQLLPTPADSPIAVTRQSVTAGGSDVFELQNGTPSFPTLQSQWTNGKPLGWDGTVGLAADQFHAEQLFTLTGTDPTQILSVNTSNAPAKINGTVPLTKDGKPYGVQASGLYQRSDGNFVIAATGSRASDNQLVVADRNGNVTGGIKLPGDVTKGLTDTGGLGGISGQTVDGTEYIWIVFKRPLQRDPDGIFRLGRYNTDDKTWAWYGYKPEADAGAIQLGNINAVGERRLALVEQDRTVSGTTAVEKIETVNVPTKAAADHNDLTATLPAQTASDLIGRFTRSGDPLPTRITGLVTAGNDHAFLLGDSARDTKAGSQAELADLGASADAFPEQTSALGVTLTSWLLPLTGVIIVGIGCLVAAGLAIRSRVKSRTRAVPV